MNLINESESPIQVATLLKWCPFCAGRACVTQAAGLPRFGVRCNGCMACLPEEFATCVAAIAAWCRRQGTVSAAGGRATKGKLSWRKGRACRRNLRRARERKKLKWIAKRCEAIQEVLKPFRAAELAEIEAAVAEDKVWLKENEAMILADPILRQIYDLMPSRRASASNGQAV